MTGQSKVASVHKTDAEPPVICPRCEQLCRRSELIDGDCPTCKKERQGNPEAHKIAQQGYFDDSGQLVATTKDNESIIQKVCEETGISEEVAIEVLYIIDKALDEQKSEFQVLETVKKKCEAYEYLIDRTFLAVQSYIYNGGNPTVGYRCAFLLLGRYLPAGASTQDKLVELLRPTLKQTVNACIRFLQKQVPQLPPLANQRNDESRERMAEARINQIGKT